MNRTISTVRAALELAAATDPRIINSAAFKVGLKKLPDAARARNVVLDDAQVRELVRLAYEEDGAFGLLIEVLAVTGARRSQAARLTVADLQDARPDPRLMMPSSLKGKGVKRIDRRPVPIPPGLAAKLRQAAQGREGLLLLKSTGLPWGSTDHRDPFQRIVVKAGLDPEIVTSYSLRHSSITRALLRGIPIRAVAYAHDTSVPMIEKTYSASIGDHSDTLFRNALLDVDAPVEGNVVPLVRKG